MAKALLLFICLLSPATVLAAGSYTFHEVKRVQPEIDYYVDSSGKPVSGHVRKYVNGVKAAEMLVENGIPSYITEYSSAGSNIKPHSRELFDRIAATPGDKINPVEKKIISVSPKIPPLPTVSKGTEYQGGLYSGAMKSGKPNGTGTLVWPAEKRAYKGEFTDGEMIGRGELWWDGHYYKGSIIYGEASGTGMLMKPDGTFFEGVFYKGKMADRKSLDALPIYEVELFGAFTKAMWGTYCPVPQAVKAGNAPIQGHVHEDMKAVLKNNVKIIPLASYIINGRVLIRQDYADDPRYISLNSVSEMDLGIGWGVMANKESLQEVSAKNANRRLSFSYPSRYGKNVPISNTHIIAGNRDVLHKLRAIQAGDVVTLSGWLVMNIYDPTGHIVSVSSVSLTDDGIGGGPDGRGGCEEMLVCDVQIQ